MYGEVGSGLGGFTIGCEMVVRARTITHGTINKLITSWHGKKQLVSTRELTGFKNSYPEAQVKVIKIKRDLIGQLLTRCQSVPRRKRMPVGLTYLRL